MSSNNEPASIFTQKPQGYHRLADLMGRYPETAIFRRFSSLNMINLLSLQAELIELRGNYEDVWAKDGGLDNIDGEKLSTFLKDSSQHELLLKLRKKLREYNEAILQARQISQMPSPEPRDIKFLRQWLDLRDFLRGSELWTWQRRPRPNENRFFNQDLMTLQPSSDEQDALSKKLSNSLLDIWNFLRPFHPSSTSARDARFQKSIESDDGIMHYSQEGLLKFNNILISVIGAAMPIVSIVALYFIETEGGRIGAMAGFTILFAFVLATCTNARRLEIAASTAAFAAVEVVFIGSDLGKS